jgi:uncharacterized membrane protein HdeD (DUF308 family)
MTDPRDTARGFADPTAPAGNGWGWLMAYGILSVLLGLGAFLWPFAATLAATLVVGAFFIASGVVSLGVGIFGKVAEGRGYAILFGAMSLAIGLVMAFEPTTGALSITLLVAIWLTMRGILEIVLGARMRRGRALMIVLGVVNVLLAIYVVATLGITGLILPGFILGISFLFSGIVSIVSATHHRKGAEAFALPS